LVVKAVALSPKSVQLHLQYAQFKKSVERYDEAEALYDKALELQPDNAQVLNNYANFLWRIRGDRESAKRVYVKGITTLKARGAKDRLLSRNYAIFLSRNKDMRSGEAHASSGPVAHRQNAHYACAEEEPKSSAGDGNEAGELV
jgi:Flp pilus assembly protein TadD